MAELPSPEAVENTRRSVAMLEPEQWAFRRDEALRVLAQLKAAVEELRRWRA
jgi:hypothetical protein